MNWDELWSRIEKVLPRATWERDNEGQIVIYTGLRFNEPEAPNEVIDFESE